MGHKPKRGRPPLPVNTTRSVRQMVPLRPDERAKLEKLARSAPSLAHYIRRQVFGYTEADEQ